MIARCALKGSSLKLESINKPNYLHVRICAVSSTTRCAGGPKRSTAQNKTPVCSAFHLFFCFFSPDIYLRPLGRLHVHTVTFKSRGSKSHSSDILHLFRPSCFRVNTKRSPPLGRRQSRLAEAFVKQSTVRLPSTQIRA